MLFKEREIKSEECLFITDTLCDIREANKVKVKTIAVTWGFHELEILNKGNPHKIIHNYEELLSTILIVHGEKVKVLYKNWKEIERVRTIISKEVYFGSSKFHPEEQWLLRVDDVDKNGKRTYALKDIKKWLFN